ncbi:MAG: DUF1080 domain-containing protein [Bacteroidetes bacterium]|nr:DUF1080 domain-containing protein [Fibrella sp.]
MRKIGFIGVLISYYWCQARAQTAVPPDMLSAFRSPSTAWQLMGSVTGNPASTTLTYQPGIGVLVNNRLEKLYNPADNLITVWEHGDLYLELDFMVPKGSNSGLYFQGRYEVHLFDSWGVESPTYIDCGSIYERWDVGRGKGKEGYEGRPPRRNAARAPGEWQHLEVDFEAPQFDVSGRKVKQARFVSVLLNGTLIQQDAFVSGPTRAAVANTEVPRAPLMIQGDHGVIAFRNIRYTVKN